MKHWIYTLIIVLSSCSSSIDERILGTWEVQSDFYRAVYKIEEQEGKIVGKLMYYNDDIKIIEATNTNKDIVFKNLKYKNGTFVDGISGATNTKEAKNSVEIKVQHKDTLQVVKKFAKTEINYIWTRKK